MDKTCSNCQSCQQYFTGDLYPEFGCGMSEEFKSDFMGYPSDKEGCELWAQNTRNQWTDEFEKIFDEL